LKYKEEVIKVSKIEIRKSTNFLEYVFGGCKINLNLAIDFTLSNGEPQNPKSLHSQNLKNNHYLKAIKAVGEILQFYDEDKEIPTYGFGACVPPNKGTASHCFALNGDIFKPECNGIEGVIEVYKKAISQVSLYGPTNFADIISEVCDRAEVMEVTKVNQ